LNLIARSPFIDTSRGNLAALRVVDEIDVPVLQLVDAALRQGVPADCRVADAITNPPGIPHGLENPR
jgi:hypothetical protein